MILNKKAFWNNLFIDNKKDVKFFQFLVMFRYPCVLPVKYDL